MTIHEISLSFIINGRLFRLVLFFLIRCAIRLVFQRKIICQGVIIEVGHQLIDEQSQIYLLFLNIEFLFLNLDLLIQKSPMAYFSLLQLKIKIKTSLISHNQIYCQRIILNQVLKVQFYQKKEMQKAQTKQNHMKKRYLCSIEGPIFFTAPHSKKLYRGGPQYKQKKRIHLREIYTSYIAMRLCKQTYKNSYMIWGKTAQLSQDQLDPNYLLPKMFAINPFHQSLHYFALKNVQKPLLHIDVHGKMNRQNNCQIDVGVVPMEVHWKGDQIIQQIKDYFNKEMNYIFQTYQFKGMKCKFNTEPQLHGYWGADMCTMTEQAAELGIISLQLQIPRAVRQKLFKDEKLMINFALGLKKLYQTVIVPYKITKQSKIQKKYLQIFKPTITTDKQREQSMQQVTLFQSKQQLNLNIKKI